MTKEQQDALHELEINTHTFWGPSGVIRLTEPFGFKGQSRVHKADYKNPKGLHLRDGSPQAEGAASWDITYQILRHYNLKSETKLGRGFQVRADCEAIRKHLGGTDVEGA